MKYTTPVYNNEALETKDVITESDINIQYVKMEAFNPSTGKVEKVDATQVGVNVEILF